MIRLYGYWRSSAAYRVRIALNLKGLEAEHLIVSPEGPEPANRQEGYLALNPAGKIPTLEIDGHVMVQSLAILDYLEETRPQPPLLPRDPADRAAVRAFCLTIAADVHPVQNGRVLNYLRHNAGFDDAAINAWAGEWMTAAFSALEDMLERRALTGPYAFGPDVTMADLCLVPQLYNARRFHVDLSPFHRLTAIEAAACALPAFARAAPEAQPDYPGPGGSF